MAPRVRCSNPNAAKRRNYPGLDRAIAGVYPPGSTFKPVTALAALEDYRVSPYEALPCTPSYTYVGDNGVPPFKNWNPYVNTAITMPIALAWSCDTYFYELGVRFYKLPGAAPLQQWAKTFGFGRRPASSSAREAPA